MLTLDVMERIRLYRRPASHMIIGSLLDANFRFPATRTDIRIEGLDRLPRGGRVFLAMNHTDRFNYFPFQVRLWKLRDEFTATWVKGKYYNNPLLERLMVATNNIPTPSKGYVITADCMNALGAPPDARLYRVVREAMDRDETFEEVRSRAEDEGVVRDFDRLERLGRDMLGRWYNPSREHFVDALRELFGEMMDRFVALNEHAFDVGLKILVFPEGTRSRRLSTGRPGLAQMAVRTAATIVPIGCNGSDIIYPGDNPISSGGQIVYRIGEPLTPDDALAPFQVSEPFKPFTHEADPYADVFDGVTELVMDRIAELLDARHLPSAESHTEVEGARRFV